MSTGKLPSGVEAQMRIRQMAGSTHDHLRDLMSWQEEIKAKDRRLAELARSAEKVSGEKVLPPVRGSQSSQAVGGSRETAKQPRQEPTEIANQKGQDAAGKSSTNSDNDGAGMDKKENKKKKKKLMIEEVGEVPAGAIPQAPVKVDDPARANEFLETVPVPVRSAEEAAVGVEKPYFNKKKDKLSAYDYAAWDKFDVDAAMGSDDEDGAKNGAKKRGGNAAPSTSTNNPTKPKPAVEKPAEKKPAEKPKSKSKPAASAVQPNKRSSVLIEEISSSDEEEDEEAKPEQANDDGEDNDGQAAPIDNREDTVVEIKARGDAFMREGKYPEAAGEYTRLLSIDPSHLAARGNRALARLRTGHYAGCVSDCDACLVADPGNLKALYRRGMAYKGLGKYGEARGDIEAVLSKDPSNVQARQGLKEIAAASRSGPDKVKKAVPSSGGDATTINETDGPEEPSAEEWIAGRPGTGIEVEIVKAAQVKALVTMAVHEGAKEAKLAKAAGADAEMTDVDMADAEKEADTTATEPPAAAETDAADDERASLGDEWENVSAGRGGTSPEKPTGKQNNNKVDIEPNANTATTTTTNNDASGKSIPAAGNSSGSRASSVDGFDMVCGGDVEASATAPSTTRPVVNTTQTPPTSNAPSPKGTDASDASIPAQATTAADFEAHWRSLRSEPTRFWRYLSRFEPSGLRPLLKESLTADMLSSVADAAIDGHLATGGDPAPVLALLEGFSQVRRFGMLTMFFERKEKERFARLFDAVREAGGDPGKLRGKYC